MSYLYYVVIGAWIILTSLVSFWISVKSDKVFKKD